jgi:hypothetical protein
VQLRHCLSTVVQGEELGLRVEDGSLVKDQRERVKSLTKQLLLGALQEVSDGLEYDDSHMRY